MPEDKKTQIGGPGRPGPAADGPRIRPPTAEQQVPNKPVTGAPITGAPQNVIVAEQSGAAKTEFLTGPPPSVTPPPARPATPAPNLGSSPPVTGAYVPPNPNDVMIGQTVGGRYYIQKKLGEGGMGSVYLATHNILDKQVALKVLHGEFARKPDLVERFMQEAKAASRIRNENVIDVSDFGSTNDGLVFFAMELLKGHDLHDEIARARLAGQLLPWSRTKRIFLQICSALAAAHALGIVHRDLKPENVFLVEFLGDPDFVKLLDFGIAKLTEVNEEGRKLTKTGMLFGTPEYMSPEQARGETADHRVDVYAMGCILFQLITTRVPFEADNFMGVLSLHLTEHPPAIPDEVFDRIGAPRALGQIIDKALEKDRNQRFQTIEELANAVRIACGEAPVTRGTEVIRAASVPAPATTTTSRAAVTPAPLTVNPTPAPSSPTPAPGVRKQWTGSLQVPVETVPPAEAPRSKMPLVIGAAILIAGGAIAAALVVKSSSGGKPPDPPPVVRDAAAATPPPPADAPPAPDKPLPAEVVVKIESVPKLAEVIDVDGGNAVVGHTSEAFHVTPGHNVRHYLVRAKGYVDAEVILVPEEAHIEKAVTLDKVGATIVHADAGVPVVKDAPAVKMSADAAVIAPPPAIDAAVVAPPPPADAAVIHTAPNPDCPNPDEPCLKRFPDAGN